MKITDFEIGKKYALPCWDSEFIAYKHMGCANRSLVKFDKDGKFIEYFRLFKSYLETNDWIEVKAEDDDRNLSVTVSELFHKLKRAEAEILADKQAIYDISWGAAQDRLTAMCLGHEVEDLKKELKEAVDILKWTSDYYFLPGFPVPIFNKIRNFLNNHKD